MKLCFPSFFAAQQLRCPVFVIPPPPMACRWSISAWLLIALCLVPSARSQTTPEQIHTSYTLPNTITVTWAAQNDSTGPTLKYSSNANLIGAISVAATRKIFKGSFCYEGSS